jgi:hypothetical protein
MNGIKELTKELAIATLFGCQKIIYIKEEIRGFDTEIWNLEREIRYLIEHCGKCKQKIYANITSNAKKKKAIENLTIRLSAHASIGNAKEIHPDELLAILNTIDGISSEIKANIDLIRRAEHNNNDMAMILSQAENHIAHNQQRIYNINQLIAKAKQQLCMQLIKKVKQDIYEFKSGIGNPIIEFLTNKEYKKPPSDPEDAYGLPIWIIEYRERVIKLLQPLIASTQLDSHTEHSCNSFNSPFCNGLQRAKQDMESIVNTISEIVRYIDDDNDIMSNLYINTIYANELFLNSLLFELVSCTENIDDYHLGDINSRDFSDHRSSGWDTERYVDDYGEYEYRYSYADRIKRTFDSALLLLEEFLKIETISESRQEILTFTAAIGANNAPVITKSGKLFKICSNTSPHSKGAIWKMHICSFLGHNKEDIRA